MSFLVKYKLFCLVSVLSDALELVIMFFVIDKVLDVINVCYCCLIFLFVLTCFLGND